jgi:hypothetical protein
LGEEELAKSLGEANGPGQEVEWLRKTTSFFVFNFPCPARLIPGLYELRGIW